jgi:hypothetical protein
VLYFLYKVTYFNIIYSWKIYPQKLKEVTFLLRKVLVCQKFEKVSKIIATETNILYK